MKKLYNRMISIGFISRLMGKPLFARVLSYEFIIYVFFGVMTTVVNMAVSAVCNRIFGYGIIEAFDVFGKPVSFSWVYVTNVIAWIAAVLFAYFTNKVFVFENKQWDIKTVAGEMISFFGARVMSLLMFDLGLFALFYYIFGKAQLGEAVSYWISKILAAVFTIVFNYVFSKFIIFRKKDSEG